MPEIATSTSAALRGEIDLAVSNLLGGVVMQTMVLAAADAMGGRNALTSRAPSFGLLIQGVGLVLVLGVTATVASLDAHWRDDPWFSNAGPALMYVLMQYITVRTQGNRRWQPASNADFAAPAETRQESGGESPRSLATLLVLFGSEARSYASPDGGSC